MMALKKNTVENKWNQVSFLEGKKALSDDKITDW